MAKASPSTGSPSRAIASSAKEGDFIPNVADLPEFMPEPVTRRYGGIGAPEHDKMMARIEARVASRPLVR